jgi:hypothetical protein
LRADLFPEGRASLVICNPPWIPGRPSSPLENGIYDPDSQMLRGFLQALPRHLTPGGEGWLILSDLAEHLVFEPARSCWRNSRPRGCVWPGGMMSRRASASGGSHRPASRGARG